MTYVRGAASGAKAIAGRAWYVDADGRMVSFDQAGMTAAERHCPADDRHSQMKGDV
jgi:hypothetical protein